MTDDRSSAALSRRRLFAGASVAGAAAVVATAVPLIRQAEVAPAATKPAPEGGGGYQLTAHVQRYYETTKV